MRSCLCRRRGLQRKIRCGNARDLDLSADRLLFEKILLSRRTVDVTIDVDVGRAMSDMITCNGAVNRVPGGVVIICALASEGVQVIWPCRYNV